MTDNNQVSGTPDSGLITYPNRRYERYEKRIHRLYQIISFIRKHSIAICSGIAALTVAVLSFLFCIGIFIGEISCEDFTYGDSPSFSSKAFLTDTSYQYAKNTENLQWSGTLPTEPGEYRIRAVSQNPFGMFRYSKEAVFLLLPRPLTLEIRAEACVYGDLTNDYLYENTKITGLAKGDTVKDVEYEYAADPNGWDLVDVSIRSFRVVNADGVDVTTSYNISTQGATVALRLREITVNLNDTDKIYDGTTKVEIPLQMLQNTLAEGDRIEVSFPEFPAVVGEYPITINSYKIVNPAGEDVTHKYRIEFQYGSLEVLPRPLIFETGSAEKQFDQTPLTNPGWSLVEGAVAGGHSLITQLSDSLTYVGEYPNELLVQISDTEGTDVTANYDITVRTGTLKITPIILKFKTDSARKVYDGTKLVATGYELIEGDILPSHKLICETVGMQLDVGRSDNALHIEILDSDNRNLIDLGYQLEIECGTLTVTPRIITFTSESKEKLYDGTPLTHKVMTWTSGTPASGQSVSPAFTGSQTKVGESPNTFSVKIYSNSNEDVTKNYDISYVFGTLTVLPNEDYVPNTDGGGSDSGTDFGDSTRIDYPTQEETPTQVAKIKITGSSAYLYFTYLRARSYGDYTGSGFIAPSSYANDNNLPYISSIDFVGRNASADEQRYLNRSGQFSLADFQQSRINGCDVVVDFRKLGIKHIDVCRRT